MSSSYHGKVPVTKDDFKMAKKHLKATYKLNKGKIKDHQKAAKEAQKQGNTASVSYNQSHLSSHQKDNTKVQQSMNTVNNLKPVYNKVKGVKMNTKKTGSYKGQSNAPGGGGRFKQMTDNGVSPGLASYIGRKKFGAKKMASMAANGKS